MIDKCLDIAEVNWKGYNISFLSKPGLTGRNHYDTHGAEAQRSIMGGMLFTCGLENICAPCLADGKEYPMHGRMRTTPAEHVGADTYWTDGDEPQYIINISGEMREAELFLSLIHIYMCTTQFSLQHLSGRQQQHPFFRQSAAAERFCLPIGW